MTENDDYTPAPAPQQPPRRRSCIASLFSSLLLIIISAALGAALALGVLWYGPQQLGIPIEQGGSVDANRLVELEAARATSVVEIQQLREANSALGDLREELDTVQGDLRTLSSTLALSADADESLRDQIEANLDSVLALQGRIDEMSAIPANRQLDTRIADLELEVAGLMRTLERLRSALSGFANEPALEPAATPTATPSAEDETPAPADVTPLPTATATPTP